MGRWITLQSQFNTKYVRVELDGTISVSQNSFGVDELFYLEEIQDNKIALKAH